MAFDTTKLSDEERRQFNNFKDLFDYSYGIAKDEKELCDGLLLTIYDWKKKMGGRSGLEAQVSPYIKSIQNKDKESARKLYFFLSPLFFYIHVLFELSRSEWRNATSWAGSYCERVVKNLLREYDRCYGENNYVELEGKKFADQSGRLRAKLQGKQIDEINELYNLVEILYTVRNTRGPHDVPPPEPLKAQINANHCLPVYINYLEILNRMNNDLTKDFTSFVNFFSKLTEFKIALIFGSDNTRVTVEHVVKNILYREGFFSGMGKPLSDIQAKIQESGYVFSIQSVNNVLGKLSKGKEAVLTKKGKKGYYVYCERYPPQDIFKTTL